jgi:queuine tRNA-ribosyltransferase subunit QTRTD1
MHQYSKFFANVRQSIQEGTFEEQADTFVAQFGAEEPIRVPGEIHPAQMIVEASLTKRSRLNGSEDNNAKNQSSSMDGRSSLLSRVHHLEAIAAEKEQQRAEREIRREQRGEDRRRIMVNKKEKRLQRKLTQLEQQRQQQAPDN